MFNANAKIDPDPYPGAPVYYPAAPKPPASPLRISTLYWQAADIADFLRVQNNVRPTLLKPYHLKERRESDIRAHLDERMPLIGARAHTSKFDPGTPVAACLLSFLKNHEAIKNLAGYPDMGDKRDVTAIVQSLCVDPAYSGMGISQGILHSAANTAQQNGMTRVISAIADDNPASIKAFKAAGYEVFARGVDPKQGYTKTFYCLSL